MHGALLPARRQLVEHRVNRCDASAASDHNDRSLRVFAQIKRAEWAFQPQDPALRHLVGCPVGEAALRPDADMQFQGFAVRTIGDRKAAAAAVLDQQVELLARQLLDPLALPTYTCTATHATTPPNPIA